MKANRIGAFGWAMAAVVVAGLGCSSTHGSSATDAGADAGANVDPSATLSAGIGPVSIPGGRETTVCIVTHVDNVDPLYVTRIVADLAPGSHHLIIYQQPDTVEEHLDPTLCAPFRGITQGDKPIMIVEKPHDELVFPDNVALKFEPHQKLKFEAHYVNTTSETLQGAGVAHFEGLPPAKATGIIESNLAFWGQVGFTLPPHAVTVSKTQFQTGIPGTKGFAMTTHQHRMGTHLRVWSSASDGDPAAVPLADTTDWAEPPLYRLNPEIPFDGSNGLSFQCEWNNTTDQVITYGEGGYDEMCFVWMYYYPSYGFDICVDGECRQNEGRPDGKGDGGLGGTVDAGIAP